MKSIGSLPIHFIYNLYNLYNLYIFIYNLNLNIIFKEEMKNSIAILLFLLITIKSIKVT